MFAEKLGIKLHELEVEVSGNLNTDGFLGDENVKIGFTDIHATYRVKADNTEAEISHFVEFVESHCPVGDTLINPASISFGTTMIEQIIRKSDPTDAQFASIGSLIFLNLSSDNTET